MATGLEATLTGPVPAEFVAAPLAFVIDIPVPAVSVALVWGPRLRILPTTFFRKS